MVRLFFILSIALAFQHCAFIDAAESAPFPDVSSEILAKLSRDLEHARNATGTAGLSVAVMYKGKVIFAEGFGKRNAKEPFTAETASMIASVTKPFTATAIGELVAEGKMDWDATPVNTYLPEFETIDPVLTKQLTMQDLLSHRTNYPSFDPIWMWGVESRRDLIKRIRHIKVDTKLRSTMNYNNILFCVAAEAGANVFGTTVEKLVETKILKPLKLSRSGFSHNNLKRLSNHATPLYANSFEDAVAGKFSELSMEGNGSTSLSAASGDMYSTVLDLVRWGQVALSGGKQDGKQVLNKESVQATLAPKVIDTYVNQHKEVGRLIAYGMGWGTGTYRNRPIHEHSGRSVGYTSNLVMFPEDELIVALLSNVDITGVTRFAPFHVADLILGLPKTNNKTWLPDEAVVATKRSYMMNGAILEGQLPEKVNNTRPSHSENAAFVGEYYNPGYGSAVIRLVKEDNKNNNSTKMELTIAGFSGILSHYHYDSYLVILGRSTVLTGDLATFITGPDGAVTGFKIPMWGPVVQFDKQNVAPN
ncbi:hypothetical protein BG004_000358 [Podila humilis]|nr:hypothetical protein BG004_000358 [Podila humilis]